MPLDEPLPERPLRAPLQVAAPAAGVSAVTVGRPRALRWLALLPALLCVLIVAAPPLNHDVAAVLNFAERWLGGERLYVDLIDVNPPLIFVLNLLPAAIGAVTPLTGADALLLCLIGLCLGSAAFAARLLRDGTGAVEAAVLPVALALAALAAGYDFGQREHLMLVAALPYLALSARRADGRRTAPAPALAAAALAAFGFALKPHFLAVPALVEAYVLLRRGPRAFADPVPWCMATLWLLYLASLPLLFPAYLGHVLPLVWDYYLALGGLDWWAVLLTERLGTALLLLLPLSAVALRGHRGGALPAVLALAALGATVACLVQHKGWSYHALPVRLLAGLLALVLAARWLDGALPRAVVQRAAPGAALAGTCAIALFAFTGAEAPWRQLNWSTSQGGEVARLIRREAYGERLLVLSPDIYPVYPALNYARAQSTLRTMNLWLLQGVYAECLPDGARYRQTWEMPRAEFFVYRTVAEDFSRAPPAAVLIARHPGIPWCGEEFDFLDYFSRHPLFAATFGRYRLAATTEGYDLYKRED